FPSFPTVTLQRHRFLELTAAGQLRTPSFGSHRIPFSFRAGGNQHGDKDGCFEKTRAEYLCNFVDKLGVRGSVLRRLRGVIEGVTERRKTEHPFHRILPVGSFETTDRRLDP